MRMNDSYTLRRSVANGYSIFSSQPNNGQIKNPHKKLVFFINTAKKKKDKIKLNETSIHCFVVFLFSRDIDASILNLYLFF